MGVISIPGEVCVAVVAVVLLVLGLLLHAIFRLLAQVLKLKEILANDMLVTFISMKEEEDFGTLPTLGPSSENFWT